MPRLDCASRNLSLDSLLLLLLLDLEQQGAVDVRQDTSEGDGCADQRIQFLVSADGELQVARRNTLDFEVLRSVLFKEISASHVDKERDDSPRQVRGLPQ